MYFPFLYISPPPPHTHTTMASLKPTHGEYYWTEPSFSANLLFGEPPFLGGVYSTLRRVDGGYWLTAPVVGRGLPKLDLDKMLDHAMKLQGQVFRQTWADGCGFSVSVLGPSFQVFCFNKKYFLKKCPKVNRCFWIVLKA